MTTLREVAQQVRDRADIVEIVRGYVELRRAGSQWKGLCPFHKEKTPSFHVHPARQGWHCFGCGKGGSVIDFVMGVEKLEFVEALELLCRRLGIEMPQRPSRDPERARESEKKRDRLLTLNQWALQWFRDNLKAAPRGPAAAYIRKRKLQPRQVEAFQLGASPDTWQALLDTAIARGYTEDQLVEAGLAVRNPESGRVYDRFRGRLIFPILDHLSRCIGFGGRVVVEDPEKRQAKYINSSETLVYQKGRSLYGLFQAQGAIEKRGRVIVVEGYLDCIMCHQAGFAETVATLGTALTPDQARLLRRFCRQVIFLYDGDEAGQNAMKRGGEVLVRAGLQARVAVLSPEDDPDSLILREGTEGFARLVDSALDVYDYFLQLSLPKDGSAEILHRIAAVDSIAPLLLALDDPVERNLRIQSVARQVGVDPPAIEAYLARRDRRRGSQRLGGTRQDSTPRVQASLAFGDSPTAGVALPPVPLMELGVLRGIVENDALLPWVRQHIEPGWLDPAVSDLVRAVMDLKTQNEFDALEFYAALQDEQKRNVYASALFKDDLDPPRNEREWQEVQVRLEVRHLKQCALEWLAATQSMLVQNPDHPLPADALREFQRLNREAHEAVRRLERRNLIVKSAVRLA